MMLRGALLFLGVVALGMSVLSVPTSEGLSESLANVLVEEGTGGSYIDPINDGIFGFIREVFSKFWVVLVKHLQSDVAILTIVLSLSGAIAALFYNAKNFAGELMTWCLYTTVEVNLESTAYGWMKNWMHRQTSVKQSARTVECFVQCDIQDTQYDDSGEVVETEGHLDVVFGVANGSSHVVKFVDSKGQSHKVDISCTTRKVAEGRFERNEQQFLLRVKNASYILGGTSGKDVIKELIESARDVWKQSIVGQTKIKVAGPRYGEICWRDLGYRPSRPLDTVILPSKIRDDIPADVQRFLQDKSWYSKHGIPYRRGYLLFGPPGCGKTSFVFSLAGLLGWDVCILNLNVQGLTDDTLLMLMSDAPRTAIILLEDIDSAFSETKSEPKKEAVAADDTEDGAEDADQTQNARKSKCSVTFSGLLNALDGVGAQEGRVTFMTTNHERNLDPAITRPGRVDRKVLFDYASLEQVRLMFLSFFETNEFPATELEEMADSFCKMYGKERRDCLAKLQGYFVKYRGNPKVALEDFEIEYDHTVVVSQFERPDITGIEAETEETEEEGEEKEQEDEKPDNTNDGAVDTPVDTETPAVAHKLTQTCRDQETQTSNVGSPS